MNTSNSSGFGIAMAIFFLLPISQSLIIFGVDYYYTLVKKIVLKIKLMVRKCKEKKSGKIDDSGANKDIF